MNKRICPECSTVNESEYIYCKNCGLKLAEEPQKKANNYSNFNDQQKSEPVIDNFEGRRPQGEQSAPTSKFNNMGGPFMLDSIDGCSREEIAAFVGAKAGAIYPKLSKMELSRSKISWCWPPALLGLGFGPLGAAIWFFYRKMYKIALIFVAIGIIIGGFTSFLNRDTILLDESKIEAIIEENISESGVDFGGLIRDFSENIGTESSFASAVTEVADMAAGIIAGMLALYWYKRFVVNKIHSYRQCGIDPRYYNMGLAAVGGTSGGMAALGVAILYIAQIVFDLIPNLI